MTVKDLKELLEQFPDDATVGMLLTGEDANDPVGSLVYEKSDETFGLIVEVGSIPCGERIPQNIN